MKNRFNGVRSVWLVALLLMLLVLPTGVWAHDMSGSGTADDPYIVSSEDDLRGIGDNLSAHYMLSGDIAPKTWTAAISTKSFTGTLDGNGYTITLPDGASAPLFSSASVAAVIKNLRLVAPDISSDFKCAGILYGAKAGGALTLQNCAIIGNLKVTSSAATYAGGVLGNLSTRTAKIENCYVAVTIDAGESSAKCGALVGYHKFGTVSNCYYDSDLMAEAFGEVGKDAVAAYTGLTTAELKGAADKLNAGKPAGMLGWQNDTGSTGDGYPVFAEHTEIVDGAVSIEGKLEVGKTLTAVDTYTSKQARSYKWYRVDGKGNETLIEGVTAADYTLTAADTGYKIKVFAKAEGTVGGDTDFVTSGAVVSDTLVSVSFDVSPADAKIAVVNSANIVVSNGTKNMNLAANSEFTCYVGRDGYLPQVKTFSTADSAMSESIELVAKELDTSFSSAEEYNMQTGNLAELANFPTEKERTVLKWAKAVGTNFNAGEPTNPVFVGGKLYMVGSNADEDGNDYCLKMIDPATGTVEKKVKIAGTTAYTYNYFLTNSEDMLFLMVKGSVEAYDTDLNRLWVSDTVPGSQGLCPINYSDGFVYGGTCASLDAGFFCMSAVDGSMIWFNAAEVASDGGKTYTGSYWAGGCIVGDYVIYGSSGGRVYVVDKLSGSIIERLDIPGGKDIRSSVAYDGEKIYFTSVDGYVNSAELDAATGRLSNLQRALIDESVSVASGNMATTATPVVYDGRVYVGSANSFAVFEADDLGLVHRVAHNLGALRDMRLVYDGQNGDAGNNCVYVFSTYYSKPGGVVMFKVVNSADIAPVMTDLSDLLLAGMEEYAAAMPIFGADGTIYAANDKGYLAAYTGATGFLTDIVPSIGNLSADFAENTLDHELIVPVGTKNVQLLLPVTEGATLTVNDEAITDGKYNAELKDGKAALVIEVAKDTNKLTYTLAVREIHTETAISVVSSTSNSITAGTKVFGLYGDTDNVIVVTGGTKTNRLWLAATDVKAETVKPVVLQGNMGVYAATGTNVYSGLTYPWRLYAGTVSYPLVAKTEVIAENGDEQTYYVLALADAEYNGTDTYVLDFALKDDSMNLKTVGDSGTVGLDLCYVGDAPAVSWASLDESVAVVDQSGKVTAKGMGDTVVTATCGGTVLSCNVTVKNYTTVRMTYSIGSSYVTGMDAGKTELYDVAVDVHDSDGDGVITVDEAFAALHEKYCAAGKAGYGSSYGYVNRFWGQDTYNVSYMINDSTLDGSGSKFTTALAIAENDRINIFEYQDAAYSDIYTYFASLTDTARVGVEKTFTVKGYGVMSETAMAPKGAVAAVYDANGKAVGLNAKVDENGKFTITFPSGGTYTVEVSGSADYQSIDWTGSVVGDSVSVTPARCVVTVSEGGSSSGGGGGGSVSSEISVSFRLIGATLSKDGVDLSAGVDDSQYVTWIATRTCKLAKGSTDLDLFKKALDEAGIDYDVASSGWLNSVTAPNSLGGHTLADMTNGDYSGWMYTLNGTHKQATLGGTTLKSGDKFIVHYINDYRYEDSQWATGSLGSSSLWDRWLKAKDSDPAGGSSANNGSGSTVSSQVNMVISANAEGEAKTSISAAEANVIIAEAVEDNVDEIVIAPKVTGEADSVTVSLPVNAAVNIASKAEAALTLRTDMAEVTLGVDDLAALRSTRGSLVISVKSGENGTVSVGVTAGDADVTLKNARVILPKSGAAVTDVPVIVNSDGSETVVSKSIGGENGVTVVFEGNATYRLVSREVDFADTGRHWAKDAAAFVAARSIFNGTGENTFAPNEQMSRAMAAVVLYRLESEPESAGGYSFSDGIADWAMEAAGWAAEQKIISGNEDGTFRPDNPVTRQELATMLYRYAGAMGMNTVAAADISGFADSGKVADWAKDAMKWMAGTGLMQGNDDNTINPEGTASRAEVAVIMQRLVNMIVQ